MKILHPTSEKQMIFGKRMKLAKQIANLPWKKQIKTTLSNVMEGNGIWKLKDHY